MRLPNWRDWISLLRGARAAKRPARSPRRRVLTTHLSLRRLEERRVLDGALPAALVDAVGVLSVNAGAADGSADVIQIAREQDASRDVLEVTINGEEIYRGEANSVHEIHVAGSSDDDTLIVDFGEGSPIPAGGIYFAAGSLPGTDTLELRGGAADRIAYSLTGGDAGTVAVTVGGSTGTVEYSTGLHSVVDIIHAARREFELGDRASSAQLGDGDAADGTSQFELTGGTSFQFANPTESLILSADSGSTAAHSFDVSELDSTFDADFSIRLGHGDSVHFSGSTSLGTGSLDVSAGMIDVDGSIVSQGGSLTLDAGSDGTLLVSGTLDASGRELGQHGGTIELLGSQVGLFGEARLDASGDAGGGGVHMGGDFHGSNPLVGNADRVYIGANVHIHADALRHGDGGEVVVWSDEITRFHGNISARGGVFGGNGGLAEVSGLRELAFAGRVDLSAPLGAMGTLWLDPLVIRIKNQSTGSDDNQLDVNVPTFGDGAGLILFDDAAAGTLTISETALEASVAHLILQSRNETVLENLSTDGVLLLAPNVNITLQTRNDALLGDSAVGGVSFDNFANTIQTQGTGTITIQAGVTANAAGIVSTRQGSADLFVGNLKTGGGAIVLEASRNIFATNATDSAGGAITIGSDTRGVGDGYFFLQPAGSVTTGGNQLTIVGADIAILGTLNSGTGDTTLVTTAGRTVRLGLGTADYTLDPLELQHITAANLTVGDSTNGDISVNGVTATDLSNISGVVMLLATGDNRSVAFGGFPSSFRTLTVRADNGISVIFGSPVTTVGDLILDGDADNSSDGDDAIHFAVGVTLESAATMNLKATTGGLIGDRALTLLATQGITLESSLTVPGPGFITINADSDGDGAGVLTMADGITIDSTDDPLTIITADLNLNATSTLNSGAGPTFLQTTNGRTMGVGIASGDWQLSGDELSRITANGLTIGGAANGDIRVEGVTLAQSDSVGLFTVQAPAAGKKVLFQGTDSTFLTLSATADAGIDFSAGLTLNAAAGSLQFQTTSGNLVGAGGLILNAVNGVSLNSSLATAGALFVNTDADANGTGLFTLASGQNVTTNNNPLLIVSAEISLLGSISSGTADTTLVTTAGRSVRLGFGTADYTLDNSELQHVTAANLTIGDSTNGDISVVGVSATDVANVSGMVTLLATANGRTVAFGGLSSTFRSLTARADNGISIGFGVPSTTVGDLILDGDFDNAPDGDDAIRFALGVTLESAGAMDLKATTGGLIGDRALTLRAGQGIVLENSLTVPGLGFLTINADTNGDGSGALNLANGITVDSTDDPLTIIAADLNLNATSTLTSGTGPTILQTTNGRTMGVGNASGNWQLSGDELSRITSNGLTIGGTDNGHVMVDGVNFVQSDAVGPITLQATGAGQKVVFQGADLTFVALSAMADAGIDFSAGLTLTAADGGLQFQTATGNLIGAGSLTLNATNAVSFNSSLVTAGALAVNADTDANGTGTFAVASGNNVNTGGNPLSILSADINLQGTLNSGAADTTLAASTLTHTMGIGNAAGDWQLNGLELLNITAANLILGGATNGNVVVDGVTAAQLANVAGELRLLALGAGRNITFATSPSTFRSMTAAADNGIQVNMNIATTVGNLVLDGDADNAADGDDAIHFAPVTLTSAALLRLQATTGGMVGAGSLNLLAQNGVQLDSSLTLPGPLTIDADTDANGTGVMTVSAGQTVTTSAGPLSITSADIDLQGSLNSGAATTTLQTTNNRTMGVGTSLGEWRLDGGEFERITAGNLVIGGSANDDVTVGGVTAANSGNIAGTVTVNAAALGKQIHFEGPDSTFRALTANAESTINFTAGLTLTATAGDLDFESVAGMLIGAGSLDLNATGAVVLGSSLVTSGALAIHADSDDNGTGLFQLESLDSINTTSNPLSITSADIDVGGLINGGSATATLRATNGRTMGVGTSVGQWNLNGLELSRFTAGNLVLGDATNGDVTVGGVAAAESANIAGTVTVNAIGPGKMVHFEGPDSSFRALTANAGAGIDFTAGLTLTATVGDLTLQTATGTMTGAGALTLNAAGAVNLQGSLTTSGPLTISADTNADGTGAFALAAGQTVSTTDNLLSITSADIDLQGMLNSGAGDTTLAVSVSGRTIAVGNGAGDWRLGGDELQRITAANLTVGGAANGNMTVDGITAVQSVNIAGILKLQATGDDRSLSFSGSPSTFRSLTAEADNGITVSTNVATTIGDLILDGDFDDSFDGNDAIQFAGGMLSSAKQLILRATTGGLQATGNLVLQANNGVKLEGSLIMTGAGSILINDDADASGTGTFEVTDGFTVNSGSNPLTIISADIDLHTTGTLDSGAATTTLQTTNGRTMGVGTGIGQWQLSGSELQRITAGNLVIGDATNGDVTVGGVTSAQSANIAGTVTLNATAAGKKVLFEVPDSTFRALAANSDGGMNFTAGLTLTASAGDMTLQSPGPLTAAGALTLNAAGSVTLQGSLTTAGALNINADTDANATGIFSLAAGQSINTTDHALEIHSADIGLMGTLNSGTADTTLVATAGRPVRLGLATADYTLDGTELQHITAANLTVGDTTNGNISVNGVAALDLANISGMITLLATGNGRGISFGGNSSFFPRLTARADNGIFVGFGPPSTTLGDFILDGDADNSPDGDDAVRFDTGMVLESAGAIRLKATTGGLLGNRALTLNAVGGVTLESTLTVPGPGFVTIHADTNADGIGDLNVFDGAGINSTDDPLMITSADINLNTTAVLTSGAGPTSLFTTNGRTMGVGNAAGDWRLSGSELQRITANGLTIGGTANGDASVDGVTAAQTATAGLMTIQATGSGKQVHFQGADSAFSALSAQANAGIDFSAGITLTATTGALSFQTATGGLTGVGALTLNAANTVQFNSSLTTAGALAINADDNADGTGILALVAGQNVSTTNHALSIISADVSFLGTLNSGAADTTLVATAGRAVRIGQGTAEYTIDSAELQKITAANLTIGDGSNGDISVNGVAALDLANIAGTVNLLATGNGRSISFIGNSSAFPALAARADNGILVGFGPPKTTVGDLFFDGDADNSPDGDDAVRFASEIVLESAGALRLKAATGGLVGDRALTLRATRGVTLEDSLTVPGPGLISILADTDADGIGDFLLAAARTVNSFSNPLSVVSADIDLLGFLNSGTAPMLLKPSRVVSSIGIEDGASDFVLDNTELNHIVGTTGVITIGETGNVGGITIGINGPLALGTRNFDLMTGASVLVGTNDFTTTGTVAVRADADGNGTGTITNLGGVVSAGALTMRAAQGIDLLVGAGTMDALNTVSGDISLDAIGAIQVNRAVQNAAGNIFLTAAGSITVVASQPGVSALSGEVQLDANGATADIAVNSLVETADFSLSLLADRGVTFGSAGNASTTGGNITIRADEAAGNGLGAIAMSEGSFVESATGAIVAVADGSITLGRIETGNATADAIQLTTTSGGIVDSGDTAATRNLVANAAGAKVTISAQTGVGSSGALETTIAELDLVNALSGSIDLSEADGILIDRIEQGGAGFVRVTAGGSVTLVNGQPGIATAAGGDVNLTANGTLAVNAPIAASGGNGSILLTAGGNLTFGDTGSAVDVSTQGSGAITADSGGTITVDPGVVLESGTGALTTRFPALDVVVTAIPQVLGAEVTLDVTFGDAGARNFTITVDWSDGVTESVQVQDPGTEVFFHQYQTNPNSNDPTAVVPVSVTVASDPNIQLRGADLPTVLAQSADSVKTASDEPGLRTLIETNVEVPGFINLNTGDDDSGEDEAEQQADFFFIDTSLQAQQSSLLTASLIVGSEITQPLDFGQTNQSGLLASVESSLVDERQVILQVLNPRNEDTPPNEKVEDENEFIQKEDVLDDLPGFFRKLPDGHYRIQLREPGETRRRLIIDVEIRQGKPASGSDEGQDKPPTADAAQLRTAPPAVAREALPVALPAGGPEFPVVGALPAVVTDPVPPRAPAAVSLPDSDAVAEDVQEFEPSIDATQAAGPAGFGALVAVGLVAVGTNTSWRQRVGEALKQTPADGFGTAARLRRRLKTALIDRFPGSFPG